MDRSYRISELAERVALPATTLRYYETQGLLPARRTPAGYRTYTDSDVERVRFITTAKDLGLPLDRIRELLGVWQQGMCRDVRAELTPLVRSRIQHAEHRISELEAFRDHLTAAVARLDALPARDSPCDPACAFLTSGAPAMPPLPPRRPAPRDSAPAIACSLTAAEYTDRAARWRTVLTDTTREQMSDGGIRVRLPAEKAEEIAGLVASESRCCPFFTFRLTFTAAGVELDARAPTEATPLLHDLFATTGDAAAC